MTEEINLQNLIVPEKVVEMPFPGIEDWVIEIAHVSREVISKERNKCMKKVLNKKTRQMEDVLDEDKFLDFYVEKTIRGWKGLKLKYLKELLVVELGDLDEEKELPYSHEQAVALMKNSSVFDEWVMESVTDIQNFT